MLRVDAKSRYATRCYPSRHVWTRGGGNSVIPYCLGCSREFTPSVPQSTLMVQGLGQGQVRLNGFWQFHLGDDLRWASPLSTILDGSQSLPPHHGEIKVMPGTPASRGTGATWIFNLPPGAKASYTLLMPPVDDAYEVYWNGKLVGASGKLPPHPRWYYTAFSHAFDTPRLESGTVAIRVWKSRSLVLSFAIHCTNWLRFIYVDVRFETGHA